MIDAVAAAVAAMEIVAAAVAAVVMVAAAASVMVAAAGPHNINARPLSITSECF